jgi:hypothetical protein
VNDYEIDRRVGRYPAMIEGNRCLKSNRSEEKNPCLSLLGSVSWLGIGMCGFALRSLGCFS